MERAITGAEPQVGRGGRAWLVVLVAAGLLAAGVLLPVERWLPELAEWMRGAGATGALAFAAVYVLATVLLLPGWMLALVAGLVWGPLAGTLLVSPVSVVAASAAFVLGRTLARELVRRRVARDARFAAIDAAVARSGFRIVLLLRLSPVFPFNLLNYALGLTGVRLRDYVLASWIGMLPGTCLYVWLGSLAGSAAEVAGGAPPDGGVAGQLLLAGGVLATLAVTWVVTRIARDALRSVLPPARDRG